MSNEFEKHQLPFDLSTSSHELVSAYNPTYLGRGGERLVYSVEDHPDVVIKASMHKLKDILWENIEQGQNLDHLASDVQENIEEEVQTKTHDSFELRKYFEGHALSERFYVMKVPVTANLLNEIFAEDFKGRTLPEEIDPTELWTVVTVQERSAHIDDPQRRSFNFGKLIEQTEDGHFDADTYQKITAALVEGNYDQFDAESFLHLQDVTKDTHLTNLLQNAEQDPQLKMTLQDFIEKTIEYANDSGQMLALAGQDNVIFYPEGKNWNYQLVDPLPISHERILDKAREYLIKSAEGKDLSESEKDIVRRALNFVRIINGSAALLGITQKVELISPNLKVDFARAAL